MSCRFERNDLFRGYWQTPWLSVGTETIPVGKLHIAQETTVVASLELVGPHQTHRGKTASKDLETSDCASQITGSRS
jgi:hypothetical protein